MPMALMVPMQLDALYVHEPIAVVGPTLPYGEVPHHVDGRERNADTPYLSSALRRSAFRDRGLRLEPGVHLHWALPDALTRFDAHGGLPPVPNRWLVRRTASAAYPERLWVIESDAVRFGTRPDGPCASIPWHGAVPFAWLGRTRQLGDVEAFAAPVDRLTPFDALIGGEFTFAALYSRCQGVFGLHDAEIDGSGVAPTTRYDVYGFHAELADDPITRLGRGRRSVDDALREELAWSADIDDVERTVYFAAIEFPSGQPATTPIDNRVTISLGCTAEEAIGPLFTADPSTQQAIDAIRFLAATGHTDTDLEHGLVEFSHAEGFHATSGGHRWLLRPAILPDGAGRPPDDPLAAEYFSRLCRAQQAYDDAQAEIAALRDTLYTDWCKYLKALYPHEGARLSDFPDVDEVRHHIETAVLDRLEALLARTGQLAWSAEGDHAHARPRVTRAGDAALEVYELWRALSRQIPAVDGVRVDELILAPGPRFWKPADPVVAVRGAATRPSDRHGRDGAEHDDGQLPCASVWVAGPHDDLDEAERLFGWIAARFAAGWPTIGFSRVTEQPWHPLLLEWDLHYQALAHDRDDAGTGPYRADFLTAHFTHESNRPELVHRGPPDDRSETLPVRGWSLATRKAPTVVAHALQTYLTELAEHAAEPAPVVAELQRVHQLMTSGQPILTCALSGFNNALSMRSAGPRLAVADPLAMPGSDHERFAARVAALVDGLSDEPDPALAMHPLRAGYLTVAELRVVDTFGRPLPLEIERVDLPATMPRGPDDVHAFLPPRFLHRARLGFRWLDAQRPGVVSSGHPDSSPVHGWLVNSFLDERMLVFDGWGERVGSLELTPTAVEPRLRTWPPVDPVLAETIERIVGSGAAHFGAFVDALRQAQDLIDPSHAMNHRGLAMLVSRPIAVTRAVLDLELEGELPHDQSWEAFHDVLRGDGRDRLGLDHVRVPVRLGARPESEDNPTRLDDGLIGFWLAGDDVFRAPKSSVADAAAIASFHDPLRPPHVEVSAAGAPVTVTMLVDPRGFVHAASGIVPTQRLAIDPQHVATALDRLEVSFRVGPLLTRAGHIDHVDPSDPDLVWEWTDRDDDPTSRPVEHLVGQAELAPDLELREGFLRLTRRPRRP